MFHLSGAEYKGCSFQKGICGVSVVRSGKISYITHFPPFSDLFPFFHHFNPRPGWISSFYDLHQEFHSVLFVLFLNWILLLKKKKKNRTSWKSSFEAPCLEYSFLFVCLFVLFYKLHFFFFQNKFTVKYNQLQWVSKNDRNQLFKYTLKLSFIKICVVILLIDPKEY